MKRKAVILGVVMSFAISTYGLAADEQEHKGSMVEEVKETPTESIEVGNKICPVSGEEIGKMGPAAQYEYKGKIYNF